MDTSHHSGEKENNAPRWGESPRGWNVSFIRLQFSPGKTVNEPASRKTLARLMCLFSALMQIWSSTSRNSDTQGFTITEVFKWEWNIEGGNCNGLSEPFPDVSKCVSLVAAVKVTADQLTCLFGRAICDYAPSIFTQLSFKKASMGVRAPNTACVCFTMSCFWDYAALFREKCLLSVEMCMLWLIASLWGHSLYWLANCFSNSQILMVIITPTQLSSMCLDPQKIKIKDDDAENSGACRRGSAQWCVYMSSPYWINQNRIQSNFRVHLNVITWL